MGLYKDIEMEIKISQRPLDIIYVIDTSGSMEGVKIRTVNEAMHELEDLLRAEANKNPSVQVNVRVLTFGGSSANWHIKNRVRAEEFCYKDISSVYGMTPLGDALGKLCDALSNENMPKRGLRPIIVLLSDGMPNDEWKPNLNKFLSLPWGKKATKIAIAIGNDVDRNVLSQFTTDREFVLEAQGAKSLGNFIKWTSTLVSGAADPGAPVKMHIDSMMASYDDGYAEHGGKR